MICISAVVGPLRVWASVIQNLWHFFGKSNTSLLPQAKCSTIVRSTAYPGLPDYIPFMFLFTVLILPLHYYVRERQWCWWLCATDMRCDPQVSFWKVLYSWKSLTQITIIAWKHSWAQLLGKLSKNGLTSKATCKESTLQYFLLSNKLYLFNHIFKHLHWTKTHFWDSSHSAHEKYWCKHKASNRTLLLYKN